MIAVLINNRSGIHNRESGTTLQQVVGSRGQVYTANTLDELRHTLGQLKAQKTNLIAIRGGDGTLGLVVSEAITIWQNEPLPKILSLRGGTMNVVATSLGINKCLGSAAKILAYYLKSAREMKETRISLLHVDNRYGFLFGCGCIVHFLDEYYQVAKPTPLRALRILAKNIFSLMIQSSASRKIFSPITVDLQVDGQLIAAGEHLLIAAGSVKQIGFNVRAFYLAQDQQQLHLLYCKSSPLQFICNTLNFYFGKNAPTRRQIYNRTFNDINLKATLPIRYSLDGELYSGVNTLAIKSGPTVTMLTPRL